MTQRGGHPDGRHRRWAAGRPVDLAATLGPLRRGRFDPAYREDGAAVWLTGQTPDGPATWCLLADPAAGEVDATAWGPGALWVLDRLPLALGEGDDPAGFDPTGLPAQLLAAWRRLSMGWRVPAAGDVLGALVAAVLEQKVTGVEARRSWRTLVLRYGEPAPGPAPEGMAVRPSAQALRAIPSWEWHRLGVEAVRARTILAAAAVADRIEECAALDHQTARRRLRSLPGVGEWTAAEVAQRALGDADAVSFGDFHLPRQAVYALTGATDGDDDRLRELLRPWAGHRYRVQRIVEASGVSLPRRGPRLAPRDYRSM